MREQQAFGTHPFAMLLDLERVCAEVERSERLKHLRRRVYRPLDKPLIARKGVGGDEAALRDYDRLCERSPAAAEDLAAVDTH